MVQVIAVANQKGGCGKTTTSINLSACLAFLGKKVLLIDLDPQAHSSIGLGINPEELEKSLFDVLDETASQNVAIDDIIVRVDRNLDLAPSQVVLSAIEQKLSGVDGRETRLAEKISSLKDAYDYIIIDCPPSLGLLAFNALSAADEVLVPVEPSFFSLHGLAKLMETVSLMKEVTGRALPVRSVITLFDCRTKHSREVVKSIKKFFGNDNFGVVIRKNIRLQEAVKEGKPITQYDKDSLGFSDYMNLAVEVIEHVRRPGIQIRPTLDGDCIDSYTIAQSIVNAVGDDEDGGEYEAVDCSPKQTKNGMLFSVQADPDATVAIAGDFTNWEMQPLNRPFAGENIWMKVTPLTAGSYRYKFVINGEWVIDPDNGARELNEFGGENSIVVVQEELCLV